MAVPVARVHLAVAHAALPALLPTPPKSMMLPLLPTPPRVVLPVPPPKQISRADSDERWDAHKIKPATASPAALAGQRSPTDGKTGGPGRASSCDRWDSNKNSAASSSSSSSSASTRASATSQRWASNKRRPVVVVSRASSAARWDAHKKPRPLQAAVALVDDGESSTGSNDMEMEEEPPQRALFAGPGFVAASPEPSMIPMPAAFLVRVA